jgi:hypothetical protein
VGENLNPSLLSLFSVSLSFLFGSLIDFVSTLFSEGVVEEREEGELVDAEVAVDEDVSAEEVTSTCRSGRLCAAPFS